MTEQTFFDRQLSPEQIAVITAHLKNGRVFCCGGSSIKTIGWPTLAVYANGNMNPVRVIAGANVRVAWDALLGFGGATTNRPWLQPYETREQQIRELLREGQKLVADLKIRNSSGDPVPEVQAWLAKALVALTEPGDN